MGKFGLKLNLVLITYIVASMQVFNKVYKTSKLVIDEEFHLRQGLAYCAGNLSVWDPKITTFPGLYVVSGLLFGLLNSCSIYHLRLTSLIGSVVNVILIFKIREAVCKEPKTALSQWNLALETLTIAILPPMYFFAFLYYTDVISITFVLAMVYFATTDRMVWSSFYGFCSVGMRQTNIVWVLVVFGSNLLDEIAQKRIQKKPERLSIKEVVTSVVDFLGSIFHSPVKAFTEIWSLFKVFWGFILVSVLFAGFLFYNGSIVIGDKSAHEARLHLPQICYFVLFSMFFGAPSTLRNIQVVVKSLKRQWKIQLLLVIALVVVVNYNTIVHPYLLADNRHYTFYLWNRFYGRYFLAKFAIIPVYVLGFNLLVQNLRRLSVSFSIFYVFGLFATLALQQMIEVRYFLVPFILIRLLVSGHENVKRNFMFTLLEFILFLSINVCTFYLFFHKEIRWNDYKEIQRIIW